MDSIIKKSALDEILLKGTSDSVFRDSVDKKVTGLKIFEELHKRIRTIEGKKDQLGFVMTDNSEEIGILSQCQSLQTLVSLASDFGLSFVEDGLIDGQKGTIRQIMDSVIENIVERIQIKNTAGDVVDYKFDASPYTDSYFTNEHSNIDAMTWVVTSFFLILKYHASIGEVCKWEREMVRVIRHCLTYINEAFINDENGDENKLNCGWNFTKDCKEPSLFFTYTVCECYLDMYNTFEPVLKYLHKVKNADEYGIAVTADDKKAFETKKAEYKRDFDKEVADERTARFDFHNELARVFMLINGISDVDNPQADDYDAIKIEGTLYEAFESNCKHVAEEIWNLVNTKLADNFFYNDLKNTVTENEIRMSTTSDVLFNTVYIVNIMVCAGLDEYLNLKKESHLIKKEYAEANKFEAEYNNLLESCLLAVQKAFRTYESLKNDGKDYIVDQFLVGFNEDFSDHPLAINELRKLRMRVFSLLPLLIHANNIVSEFLIKYPQHSMKKYLEYIIDNRFVDKSGDVHWIWEKDGFFSGSNYYFVLALNEFYNYHQTYEQKYIGIGIDNVKREKEIREEYLNMLEAPENTIGLLRAQIKALEDSQNQKARQIEELKEKLAQSISPLEVAVREIVTSTLQEQFANYLADALEQGVKVLTYPGIDSTEDTEDGTYDKVNNYLRAFMLESVLKQFWDVKGRKMTDEKYTNLKKWFTKDTNAVLMAYLGNLQNSDDKISKLREVFEPKNLL